MATSMVLLVYIAAALFIGWMLALQRTGFRARAIVMASLPIGGFLGGYCGGGICLLVLHLHGRGQSHNDLFPLAAAGVLGLLIGSITLPALALFLTRPKKTDDDESG